MPRSPKARPRRRPARRSASPAAGTEVFPAATVEAASLYWRWLGEAFPRYAKAVSVELAGLRNRRVEVREAAVRIARLTQEYTDVLSDLSRRILEEVDRAPRGTKGPTPRRRQGRVID